MASDNRNIHEWIYCYLESYEARGYAFYQVENEGCFSEYERKANTVMAFVEDIFFGERTLGRLDYIRKQYPKLRLVLFSVTKLSLDTAAQYLCWSLGSYLSLRDREGEIREAVEAVFGKRQVFPSYLKGSVDEYGRLLDIEPYLTHREIEIVRCIVAGKTAKETASILMLSLRTVKNHVYNIYQKFGIRNMVGVVKLAVSKGILPIDELIAFKGKL